MHKSKQRMKAIGYQQIGNRSRGKIPLLCMKCASGKRNHFGDGRVSFFFLRGIRFSLKRETTVMKKCSD